MAATLTRIAVVATLQRYLTSTRTDALAWPDGLPIRLGHRCTTLTGSPPWRAVLRQA